MSKMKSFFKKRKIVNRALFISYALTLVVLVVFFTIDFKFGSIQKEQELHESLINFKKFPFQSVANEITKVFSLLEIVQNKRFKHQFLKQNLNLIFCINNRVVEHEYIESDLKLVDDILYITSGYYTIEIDVISLTNLIAKTIAPYVSYSLYINDQITIGENGADRFWLQEIIKGSNQKIDIKLYITKQYWSEYQRRYLCQKLLHSTLIIAPILVTNIIFLSLYVRRNIAHLKSISREKSKLIINKKLLDEHLKIKRKYNALLVTEIKSIIHRKILNNDAFDEIIHYPMLIQTNTNTSISCIKYFDEILSYFEYQAFNQTIEIKYSVNADRFKTNLSELSFYQLTFSIFYNLLSLSDTGSVFKLDFQIKHEVLESIVVGYIGFVLNEEQIKSFTKHSNVGEIFLLDISQAMSGLKLSDILCEIKNNINGQQTLELRSNTRFIDSPAEVKFGKIINLKDYHGSGT